jgi:hypothetical protein
MLYSNRRKALSMLFTSKSLGILANTSDSREQYPRVYKYLTKVQAYVRRMCLLS